MEGFMLSHLLDEVHLNHGSWKATTKLIVSNIEHLGNVLGIDRVLGRVGVRLRFRLSEHRLHLSSLDEWLFNWYLSRLNPLIRDLHDTKASKKLSISQIVESENKVYYAEKLDGYLHLRWHGLENRNNRSLEEFMSKSTHIKVYNLNKKSQNYLTDWRLKHRSQ